MSCWRIFPLLEKPYFSHWKDWWIRGVWPYFYFLMGFQAGWIHLLCFWQGHISQCENGSMGLCAAPWQNILGSQFSLLMLKKKMLNLTLGGELNTVLLSLSELMSLSSSHMTLMTSPQREIIAYKSINSCFLWHKLLLSEEIKFCSKGCTNHQTSME